MQQKHASTTSSLLSTCLLCGMLGSQLAYGGSIPASMNFLSLQTSDPAPSIQLANKVDNPGDSA